LRQLDADMQGKPGGIVFSELIDQGRVASGLSKAAIARETGVARVQVIRWMRGETIPQPHNVTRLAALLGIDETRLMRLAGYLSDGAGDVAQEDSPGLAVVISALRQHWDELHETEQRAITAVVRAITRTGGVLTVLLKARGSSSYA
jgi:transcriptional regulator with XRE-family HTH domain